ncbi:hypothetical protein A9Q89_03665 [Gammaproteobacteria bacterium 53_120_T64]|nr:hypothetical protein A9Q89_03665 [Gammaproteobacteria bacterium 53_120_T64]
MRKFKILTTAVLTCTVAMGSMLATVAEAGNRTTLLVLAETHDPDSLRRDNRVSRRVRDAIQEQMNAAGFDVFDEMAVTYGTMNTDERRLTNGELVDIAKNNSTYPGTDRKLLVRAVATYQVYVNITEMGYSNKARVRVSGRLIDAQSGRFLGTYELVNPGGELRLHPTKCQERDCVLEKVGDHAHPIGQAVGNELAQLLAHDKGGYADSDGYAAANGPETYSLKFENIDADQMIAMEQYLVEVFSGYRDHQPVNSVGMSHTYDYVSTISSAKLKRNMHRAMEELGWDGKVFMDGNVVTVKHSAKRSSRVAQKENLSSW